jgi:hypothetical protein
MYPYSLLQPQYYFQLAHLHWHLGFCAIGPSHPKARYHPSDAQDLSSAVQRPVTAARLNLTHRPYSILVWQPYRCADCMWILICSNCDLEPLRPFQLPPQHVI